MKLMCQFGNFSARLAGNNRRPGVLGSGRESPPRRGRDHKQNREIIPDPGGFHALNLNSSRPDGSRKLKLPPCARELAAVIPL